MIDANEMPPVDDDEQLARFIVNGNEYRRTDNSVKPKLFMPYKHVVLSVNRHRDCSQQEIWKVGRDVAETRKRTLHGRADILARACRIGPLDVLPKPLPPANPNHADVTGYPSVKEEQLALALKLAASASKRIDAPEHV